LVGSLVIDVLVAGLVWMLELVAVYFFSPKQ